MTPGPSSKRAYLAAWLPFLPSERLRAPPDTPLVLVEKTGNAVRIVHAGKAALALGLTTGLTLADARAREPCLDARDVDRAADQELIEQLADACERYTPMTAIDGSDALILDVTGCAPVRDLGERLAALGLTPRLGRGDTPDAALARARFGENDLSALPVDALRFDDESLTALRRAGLKTIGDVAARPRASLAARFGPIIATRLARLLGEDDPRITPRRVPPAILVERRFAEPVAQLDAIVATLRSLAIEAAAELERRGEGGRRFAATLFRSDGNVRGLSVETGQPTRDPAMIVRLFDERIEALSDPIDPGFGFDLVRLGVSITERLVSASPRLDGDAREGAAVEGLIDRLNTRLGSQRVTRLTAHDTHIPEQATLALPAIAPRPACLWPAPEPGEPPLRPLHLFDPPQPVLVTAGIPDGPPAQFRWRRSLHIVTRAEGPERIAAEWWRRKDSAGLTRDYYRVEDVRGRRFWLFRHGLLEEKPDPRWYLHGLFA